MSFLSVVFIQENHHSPQLQHQFKIFIALFQKETFVKPTAEDKHMSLTTISPPTFVPIRVPYLAYICFMYSNYKKANREYSYNLRLIKYEYCAFSILYS